MPWYAWLLASLVVCGAGFAAGYWIAMRQSVASRLALIDKYESIIDSPTRRGEHHNWDEPQSTVRKGHIRNRRSWQMHK